MSDTQTVQEIYENTVVRLLPADRLRLASLILQEATRVSFLAHCRRKHGMERG